MTNKLSSAGKHVVVVGAGYAGLRAALQLDPQVRVTLIDPADHFTERVRLHETAAGRPDVTHPLRTLLQSTNVTHLRARVTLIDTGSARVHTEVGHTLDYHRLVYALGSRTAGLDVTGTSPERAYTAESAAELYKRLLDGSGALTVVGGGLTGIELATELAESHPGWKVHLATGGEIAPSVSAKGRSHIRSVLIDRGVRIEEGRHVGNPDDVDTDVVVWSASMVPNTELAVAAGLSTDNRHQIRVDSALRSLSHPEVYVAGDAAAVETPSSGPIRMACATALPLGAHAANSLVRDLRGQEPKPFRFSYQGQCMSLGRHDGLIQLVGKDDSPRDRIVTGKPAALIKEQVVRGTVRTIRMDARHPRASRLIPGAN
ncbi:NAD(P)/FAD-dependent oxidoreductase [Streptomyces sp. NPDC051644]|uniref:NAD(P)/FAD-dependent oxidoreductase n=1 Tax=Streptomyces sp. NPDC051644 TaxID=3365666 RepID=UPI0037B6F526